MRPDDRETVKRLGRVAITKSEANSVPASTAVPCRSKSRSHPAMADLIPNRSTVPLAVDAEVQSGRSGAISFRPTPRSFLPRRPVGRRISGCRRRAGKSASSWFRHSPKIAGPRRRSGFAPRRFPEDCSAGLSPARRGAGLEVFSQVRPHLADVTDHSQRRDRHAGKSCEATQHGLDGPACRARRVTCRQYHGFRLARPPPSSGERLRLRYRPQIWLLRRPHPPPEEPSRFAQWPRSLDRRPRQRSVTCFVAPAAASAAFFVVEAAVWATSFAAWPAPPHPSWRRQRFRGSSAPHPAEPLRRRPQLRSSCRAHRKPRALFSDAPPADFGSPCGPSAQTSSLAQPRLFRLRSSQRRPGPPRCSALSDGRQQLLLSSRTWLWKTLRSSVSFGELRVGLGDPVQIGQELPDLLVVVDRVGDQTLGFRMFAQNRKKMLFLKAGEGLQLILEFREQLFPGLDRAVRCVGEPLKSSFAFVGLVWMS